MGSGGGRGLWWFYHRETTVYRGPPSLARTRWPTAKVTELAALSVDDECFLLRFVFPSWIWRFSRLEDCYRVSLFLFLGYYYKQIQGNSLTFPEKQHRVRVRRRTKQSVGSNPTPRRLCLMPAASSSSASCFYLVVGYLSLSLSLSLTSAISGKTL